MTKGDKILILIVIVLSLTSIFMMKNQILNYDSKYISIQVNGNEIKEIIFDPSIIGNQLPIKTEFGYNLIEIGDERVRVIEADCPDELDVKQGWIENVGETIVCLPNKLVIELKGIKKDETIDYLSK